MGLRLAGEVHGELALDVVACGLTFDEFLVRHEGQIWMVSAAAPDVGFIARAAGHDPRELDGDPSQERADPQ